MDVFKKIKKGVYTTDSKPEKIDEKRLSEIIDRGIPQRKQAPAPTPAPAPSPHTSTTEDPAQKKIASGFRGIAVVR